MWSGGANSSLPVTFYAWAILSSSDVFPPRGEVATEVRSLRECDRLEELVLRIGLGSLIRTIPYIVIICNTR